MGGLMSWESAKRELKKLYKNPEKELLSINNDSSSYILGYSCKYMSKQQTTYNCKKCNYEMTQYQAINSYKGLCVCCYEVE